MSSFQRVSCFVLFALVFSCGVPYALRHQVQEGESAASVAQGYGIGEEELRRFNQLQEGDRLRPGDVVFIPGDRGARAPQPVSAPVKRVKVPAPRAPAKKVPAAPRRAGIPTQPPPPAAPAAPRPAAGRGGWTWPVAGEILVGFGPGPSGVNSGVDIAAAEGGEVRAARAGTVTYADTPAPAYGPIVIVEHSGGLFSVYSNLAEVRVRRGQRLTRGQVLALCGAGGNGKPAHLHFEVRRNEKAVDPLLFLPPR